MRNLEELATHLAVTFLNLPPDKIDGYIETALQDIVLYMGLDRATLYQPVEKGLLATNCWAKDCIPTKINFFFDKSLPHIYSKIKDTDEIKYFQLSRFPATAKRDREAFARPYGPRFMVCTPFFANGRNIGLISLGAFDEAIQIPQENLRSLRLLSAIFANALLKKQMEQAARERLSHLSHLNDLLAAEHHAAYLYGKRDAGSDDRIIGKSAPLRSLLERAARVAEADSTVLIQGETGVGKELIARYIHEHSRRRDYAMLSVNCAAFSPELMNSELFGHEKGAFTGAIRRQPGLFELANGSSLFFDEIGELPLSAQAKLLRVLQERRFERVGSFVSLATNVRILAATNKDLAHEVRAGRFRKDLFYRLNVFPLFVMPLRERREDIPLMVMAFVKEFNEKMGKNVVAVHDGDMEKLLAYPWPGNIRELRNVVERAMAMAKGAVLRIPLEDEYGAPEAGAGTDAFPSLDDAQRETIRLALMRTGGRISGPHGAAALLKINPKTLESRMKKLGIRRGAGNV